jgi:hypothetical protein
MRHMVEVRVNGQPVESVVMKPKPVQEPVLEPVRVKDTTKPTKEK